MGLLNSLFSALHPMALVAHVPGPPPAFPLGNRLDFIESFSKKKPWQVLARYAREHGPLVAFWVLGKPAILVADPELVEEVLVGAADRYRKVDPVAQLLPVLTGDSPLLARDHAEAEPLRERSLLARVVERDGRAWLAAQVPVIRAEVARGCRKLAEEGEVNPVLRLRRLGFDVFSQLAMGRRFGDEAYGNLMTMAAYGDQRLAAYAGGRPQNPGTQLPRVSETTFLAARRALHAAIRRRVEIARTEPDGADLLHTAVRLGDELTDDQLVHDIAGFYFGGLFSSTSTVVAALFALTHHPDEARLLASEVEQHCPAGEDHGWQEIQRCTLLDRAVRETLRLYPPVPIFFRNAVEVATLGGKEIPPSVPLWLSPWPQHHDPEQWQDPARWNPRRWTDEVIAANPYGSRWFWPFGRGLRMCGGEGFALLYIKVALATILAHSRPEVGAGQSYDGDLFFTVASPRQLLAYFPAVTRRRPAPGP